MNVRLKIQRCNFLSEGEMAIVKDTNKLIHNIVNSELKAKDKEIERLTAESTEWESKYYDLQTDLAHEKEKNKIIVKLGDEYRSKITNLQEEKTKIRKILIEHIEDARHELNVILQSDNDLNYKNECSREFEILDKNIRMILDKIDNILNGGDEE